MPENNDLDTILVVDDQADVRFTASAALRNSFQVVPVAHASDTFALAEKHHPSAILVDINMPNLDGFEIYKRIKEHPALSEIPVIFMSGNKDKDTMSRVQAAGALGFISKPFNVKELANDLTNLLDSLSVNISSKDGRVHVYMYPDQRHKRIEISRAVEAALRANEKILLLSLNDGDYFFSNHPEYKEHIQNGEITFLRIKASILSRLPFMDDYKEIFDDMTSHLSVGENHVLLFDEPESTLQHAHSGGLSNFYRFSVDIGSRFKKCHYFFKVGSSRDSDAKEIAKVLIRQS